MEYIRGKFKQMIFESDNGYKVGLFRVKEASGEMEEYINKTITFTGYFADVDAEAYYKLTGNYVFNERYGSQFQVSSYEREEPKGKDAVVEFLSSSLVKGCGEKTAIAIVDTLGEEALTLIKETPDNLLLVPGISEVKAKRIYNSIVKYQSTDEIIVNLKKLGFTINESLAILNKWGESSLEIVNNDIYKLIDIIDFTKLDKVFLSMKDAEAEERILACLIETFKRVGFKNGDTYLDKEEIFSTIRNEFKIFIEEDELDEYLDKLKKSKDIVVKKKKYFLKEYYDYEEEIADSLEMISRHSKTRVTNFDDLIAAVQLEYDVKYNTDQKKAIKNALTNRISIITGGPGTGKTTIINSIVKLYVRIHNLNYKEVINDIALLAPTGRAAKKMSDSTGLPAMTIHRYLKWNKEKNEFQINEYNKNYHKLIIVDETSMIDTYLFASLLKGIGHNITLVLVGDSNQLPSVGPGLILNDLIDSDMFTHTTLEQIYRQSDNSYIPILAKEIKEHDLSSEFTKQTDDYNFLHASGLTIKEMIRKICVMSKEKGLTEEEIQVLAPMYRGENGIDNLNVLLQDIFNPKSKDRKETKVGDITYRVGDKVLQLVNDPDNNIFNGDIGYISSIGTIMGSKNKDVFTINFDGNEIQYTREDLINIKHAYAITIHKSQGSEFAHVIMPVSKAYYKMLYNKLIYTGVSRAKKSLIIIGEEESLVMAVNNDYSNNRKTNLKEQIVNKFTPDEA
ncbi:MAG: ATP-dependent RecD-like DNA helicase [Firmicutes bacterium]|nr:ATP-dependent RecD-like DNA helicase [Bacillota bacterium]